MAFLHASKSGYFPFCLEEATEGEYGPGTDRPFEMSLEDAMTLYWKYRTFKVTGSIACFFSGIADDRFFSYSFSVIGTGNLMDNEQPKMSDVVCNNIYSTTFGFFTGDPGPNDPFFISPAGVSAGISDLEVGPNTKKTSNNGGELKIHPGTFLYTWSEVDATEGSDFFYILSQSSNIDPFFYSTTTFSDLFQIKINGTIYKAPLYIRHRNFLSGSASGFLLIEGVDERLTE
jgi:hypothetical protein